MNDNHSNKLDDHLSAEQESFKRILYIARDLLRKRIQSKDLHLDWLLYLTLRNQSPTEYPFLLRYSFARSEKDCEQMDNLAAAVHLLQTSTFVIDDIFDRSESRDYGNSVVSRVGTDFAIIAGELFQSVALEVIALELELGSFKNRCAVLRIVNEIVRDVYLGQYLDIYNSSKNHISAKEYYRMISLTTGRFLARLATCGALLAGKSPSDIARLTKFGYNYGMALQITDDIIDVVHPPDLTGKDFANDLKNRRMRLPFILALRILKGRQGSPLKTFLNCRTVSLKQVNQVAQLIRDCGAIDACGKIAKRYVSQSLRSIAEMTNSFSADHLRWLSERLLEDQGIIG